MILTTNFKKEKKRILLSSKILPYNIKDFRWADIRIILHCEFTVRNLRQSKIISLIEFLLDREWCLIWPTNNEKHVTSEEHQQNLSSIVSASSCHARTTFPTMGSANLNLSDVHYLSLKSVLIFLGHPVYIYIYIDIYRLIDWNANADILNEPYHKISFNS